MAKASLQQVALGPMETRTILMIAEAGVLARGGGGSPGGGIPAKTGTTAAAGRENGPSFPPALLFVPDFVPDNC